MAIGFSDQRETKCPQCGKNFLVPPFNVYKEKYRHVVKDFCSWTCLCAWRRDHAKSKGIGGGKPVPVLKYDVDTGLLVARYSKICVAAAENNVSPDYIKARLETGDIDQKNNCLWFYAKRKEDKKE